MGFPAYFSAPTPSFHPATYRLASGVGFSACFSHPTPMPWVSPPAFLLPRPKHYLEQTRLWIFCDKIMYSIYAATYICYIKNNSFIEFLAHSFSYRKSVLQLRTTQILLTHVVYILACCLTASCVFALWWSVLLQSLQCQLLKEVYIIFIQNILEQQKQLNKSIENYKKLINIGYRRAGKEIFARQNSGDNAAAAR